MEGKLKKDQNIVLYPENVPVKVRSLQVHSKDAETAWAGQRVAVNVPDRKKEEILRGDILATAGSLFTTMMVDVKKPTPGQDDAAVFSVVDSLQPGDTVRLTQVHYYVDDNGNMYPVRPVTKLEKVEKPADAADVPAAVPATPIQPRRMMPGRRAR